MKDEHMQILESLLAQWHQWQQSDKASKGFAQRSVGFESYRVSRQYDDVSGCLDSDLDASRCAQVNFAAEQLQDPHRAAIYMDARNLCTGLSVWNSPRLPAEPEMRDMIVKDARSMMCTRLMSAGVI